MAKIQSQRAPKSARTSRVAPADYISAYSMILQFRFASTYHFEADPRFANMQTDPRFRLPSRKHTHVEIDKRFERMLHDDDFSSRAKVDRYGRRLPKHSARKELERYYRIKDEKQSDLADESDEEQDVAAALAQANAKDDVSEPSSDESTSSEEDVEDTEEELFGFSAEHDGAEEGVPMGEPSSRLAVVNLDWDNIRAADLLAVFSSFTPGNGRILKVAIYPSEFGKERMDREEIEGPPKEIFGQGHSTVENGTESGGIGEVNESTDDADDDERIKRSILKEDEGHEFNPAKLRRYQLERLRYYYAVLNCSSISVAQAIYDVVDGTEYLTTANFFDLRFIPDEVDFSRDKPKDACESEPDGYRPNEFVTDALQHSKVKLTWDADDNTRKEVQKRAFTGSRADIDENDLKAYLGSDSSDDDEQPSTTANTTAKDATDGGEKQNEGDSEPKLSKWDIERQKTRKLLGLGKEEAPRRKGKRDAGPVGDMQVTFSSGISEEPSKGSVFENEPEREETAVEKYIRKEKERKNRRKQKLKNTRAAVSSKQDHPETEVGSVAKSTAIKDAIIPPDDLGFSDPFFSDPSAPTTNPPKSKSRKPRKELSPPPPSTSLAELELLTLPDQATSSGLPMKHFDMKEIALAEKVARRSGKKRKLSRREQAAVESVNAEGGDGFRMNVEDPRFGAVFERADFAIDPSHPRFKGTDGMKMLLEEGRRKRKMEVGEGEGAEEEDGKEERKRTGKGRDGTRPGNGVTQREAKENSFKDKKRKATTAANKHNANPLNIT